MQSPNAASRPNKPESACKPTQLVWPQKKAATCRPTESSTAVATLESARRATTRHEKLRPLGVEAGSGCQGRRQSRTSHGSPTNEIHTTNRQSPASSPPHTGCCIGMRSASAGCLCNLLHPSLQPWSGVCGRVALVKAQLQLYPVLSRAQRQPGSSVCLIFTHPTECLAHFAPQLGRLWCRANGPFSLRSSLPELSLRHAAGKPGGRAAR